MRISISLFKLVPDQLLYTEMLTLVYSKSSVCFNLQVVVGNFEHINEQNCIIAISDSWDFTISVTCIEVPNNYFKSMLNITLPDIS